MIWVGLSLIGLPHPLLWGALAGVLRFVPYVGVWIAALCSMLLAAAVDPLGWTLALTTLGLFVVIELIASQLVEPGEWFRQFLRERAEEAGRAAGVRYAEGFRKLTFG